MSKRSGGISAVAWMNELSTAGRIPPQPMIWVRYKSTITGDYVKVRFADEADARRSLRSLGVTEFESLGPALKT
jgi:hypothetical protein